MKKLLLVIALAVVWSAYVGGTQSAEAYGSCSEYGAMAYEDYSGYCTCMSGYVFQEDYLGTRCVSVDSYCNNVLGMFSRYDYASDQCSCDYGYVLSEGTFGKLECISEDKSCQNKYGYHSSATYGGSCECSYGYVLGENIFGDLECISEDQSCKDKLGYNSSATYGGGCECDYGYVIQDGQCTDGDQVCRNDHGYNASYNELSNRCECDEDYTFDDYDQCVEKQHNVYFKLLDTNFYDSEILIKSEYDYRNYIVRYGLGCFDTSISSYVGSNLVVNLGTDYDVDMFDVIVLQNHGQTCSIMYREVTYDDSFPEQEVAEEIYYYTPPSREWVPTTVNNLKQQSFGSAQDLLKTPEEKVLEPLTQGISGTGSSSEEFNATTSASSTVEAQFTSEFTNETAEMGFFSRIINFFKNLF
ncbi:MAG: hypothetical protein RL538_621 [Candidatus Parcubacteria bacterium]|jgi:hypothetical protein